MASSSNKDSLSGGFEVLKLAGSNSQTSEPHAIDNEPETEEVADKVASLVTINREATRILIGYLRENSADFNELYELRNVVSLEIFRPPFSLG